MDRGSGRGKLFSLRLSAADQAGCWAYRRQRHAAIGCRCQCVAADKCQFHVAQASPNASQSPIDDTKSVAVTLAPVPPPCGRVLRCLACLLCGSVVGEHLHAFSRLITADCLPRIICPADDPSSRVPEQWVPVQWSARALEQRSVGVLELQSASTGRRSSRAPECRSIGVPEQLIARVPE